MGGDAEGESGGNMNARSIVPGRERRRASLLVMTGFESLSSASPPSSAGSSGVDSNAGWDAVGAAEAAGGDVDVLRAGAGSDARLLALLVGDAACDGDWDWERLAWDIDCGRVYAATWGEVAPR